MIENFEKLEFNRKIDILVAMYVFDWKDIKVGRHDWEYMGESGVSWICYISNGNHVPCYSTLLTSAWDIVRKFDYLYLFRSNDFKGGQWECKLCNESDVAVLTGAKYYAWAETEQLAICYAGLKAVGFDLQTFLQKEGKV